MVAKRGAIIVALSTTRKAIPTEDPLGILSKQIVHRSQTLRRTLSVRTLSQMDLRQTTPR